MGIVECDASNVVRELKGSNTLSPLATVVKEVNELLIIGGGTCNTISMSANGVAHSLATSVSGLQMIEFGAIVAPVSSLLVLLMI